MEINLLPKFLDELATPVAQNVSKTITSLWSIVFGGIEFYAEKTNIKRAIALRSFQEEVEQKVSSIPQEKLVEPQLHIVGPTLEASKYYFENEDLRTMFSSLIASSLNTDIISHVHPSFVEIIKQLSPLDAQNISLFKDMPALPIANIGLTHSNGATSTVIPNYFLKNPNCTSANLISSSLINLERLGLLIIEYGRVIDDAEGYEQLENDEIIGLVSYLSEEGVENGDLPPEVLDSEIFIQRGSVSLSTFGEDFVMTCL